MRIGKRRDTNRRRTRKIWVPFWGPAFGRQCWGPQMDPYVGGPFKVQRPCFAKWGPKKNRFLIFILFLVFATLFSLVPSSFELSSPQCVMLCMSCVKWHGMALRGMAWRAYTTSQHENLIASIRRNMDHPT